MPGDQERFPQGKPEDQPLAPQSKRSLEGKPPPSLMEQAGFSPLLSDHIQRLNDVLKRRRPAAKSLTIELIPGERPTFTTDVKYENVGYLIQMKVYPSSHKAELAIGTYNEFPNFGLYLQDIQQFTQAAFPNRTLRLNAEPSDSLVEKPPVFDMNLKDVTEELMRPLADLQKRRQRTGSDIVEGHCLQYHAYDVLLENQKLPLFSLGVSVNWPDYPNTGRIFFPVKNFYFEGPSAEVEGLLPLVTDLFDKPTGYPYNLEDLRSNV